MALHYWFRSGCNADYDIVAGYSLLIAGSGDHFFTQGISHSSGESLSTFSIAAVSFDLLDVSHPADCFQLSRGLVSSANDAQGRGIRVG
jgi:hypothetical protein